MSKMAVSRYKAFAPYLIFLVLGLFFFPSTGHDDAHITYWAAHALSDFGEIVNYNGDRIEQSSSLLHTLLLTAVQRVSGLDVVDVGGLFGIVFGLLTIFLTGRLALVLGQDKLAPQFLLATSVPFLYWSFGGLESSLVSGAVLFLLLALIHLVNHPSGRQYLLAFAAILSYLLVRPESFFVFLLFLFFAATVFLLTRQKLTPLVFLALCAVLFFLLLTGFRLYYFHSLFPQPVTAKIGGSLSIKVICGLIYFRKSAHQYPVFILLFFLFSAAILRLLPRLVRQSGNGVDSRILVACFVAAYCLFVATSGGDWMDGARFFVPVLPLLFLLAAHYAVSLFGRPATLVGGVLFNGVALLYFAATLSTAAPLLFYNRYVPPAGSGEKFSFFEKMNREHFRNIPVILELDTIIDKMLARGIHPEIMSIQAGMIPFHVFQKYYGRISFFDLRGLTTRDLTDCPATDRLPKSHYGVGISYDYFFAHFDTLAKQCRMKRPEIIFDLNHETRNRHIPIEKAGYIIVYYQVGNLSRHSLLPGKEVTYDELIAVRSDIAHALGLSPVKIELH